MRDILIGDVGNDTYIVDNVRDIISESFRSGTDTVRASVSYTLRAHLEKGNVPDLLFLFRCPIRIHID